MEQGQERTGSGKSLDQMVAHLRAAETPEQRWLAWISANWQNLLISIGVAGLVLWLIHGFQASAIREKEQASFEFSHVQKLYTTFSSAFSSTDHQAGEKSGDSQLQSSLDVLRKNHPDSVYGQLGDLYNALSVLQADNKDAAREKLRGYKVDAFSGATTTQSAKTQTAKMLSSDGLKNEIAAYLYAKTFIGEGGNEEARTRLIALARGGVIMNVEALLAMTRIADTPEARGQVISLAQELITVRPELAAQIRNELSHAGLTL